MRAKLAALGLLALLQAGCIQYGSVDGVENLWREVPIEEFVAGTTTQADVLDRLGPPSQLIRLNDGVVFYYLAQRTTGRGRLFILWNDSVEKNLYDRAVFFFDAAGVLQQAAYSDERIAR